MNTSLNKWQQAAEKLKKDCAHAVSVQQEVLQKLMRDNADTEYGRAHHFDEVKTIADYQRLVPLSDYRDYEAAVQRMRAGEENVLTVYPIKHFVSTSGTTGESKIIPQSTETLHRGIDPYYYASFAQFPGIAEARCLHMGAFRMQPPEPERDTLMSASYFRYMLDEGTYELDERYVGGTRLLFSKGIENAPYVKVWIAFSTCDLQLIQAFFLYDILLFFQYLSENWRQVLSNVTERKIPEDLPLSPDVRAALLALPKPPASWLSHVRRECERGMEGIGRRLWPQLRWVSGIGGSSFAAQERLLRSYLGEVAVHYGFYGASEMGTSAVPLDAEQPDLVLSPRADFFEFLPYGEEEKGPCTISELKEGEQYEIVATNFSGLYRYRMADIVQVTGFFGESPMLQFKFRKNQALNIAGEKTDLAVVTAAEEEMAKSLSLRIAEFSICDDKTVVPGRYECFLEAERELPDETILAAELDAVLGRLNPDYLDLRQLKAIDPPLVHVVKAGTHAACKKQFQTKEGNNKPMQYLSDPQVISYMREREL